MRPLGFVLFAAAISAPLLACSASGSHGGDRVGESSSAIQGGTDDTVDNFTVGVCLPGSANAGPGDCDGVCTGVLITNNLVITARHCVDSINSDIVDCSSASFGGLTATESSFWITTDPSMTQSTNGWHQVSAIYASTGTTLCGNDIALLQLATNVAAADATPAVPAVQYPIYNHKHYGTAETAIGYGESTPGDAASAFTRRERQNTPVICVIDDPISSEDCATQDPTTTTYAKPNEFIAGAGTCQGDSGSGAFDQALFQQGIPTVLGVLSRGSEGDDGSVCSSAIYTRLDTFRDLIVGAVSAAASSGGYTLATYPWTTAVPDDGVYPDGGAVTPDAAVTSDAETTTTAPPGLGGACTPMSGCAVGTCENNGTATVCATTCDPAVAGGCPTGFTCASAGLCFVGDEATPAITPNSSSGGCSTGGAQPVPWFPALVALAGLVVGKRRGRRERTRGGRGCDAAARHDMSEPAIAGVSSAEPHTETTK